MVWKRPDSFSVNTELTIGSDLVQNIFEHASSFWVQYSRYELKTAKDGREYITAAPNAEPRVYDPIKIKEQLVLDALNVGLLCMGRKSEEVIREAVMDFVNRYGLLGLMTAVPTTPQFMDYQAVYFLKTDLSLRKPWKPTSIWRCFTPLKNWIW